MRLHLKFNAKFSTTVLRDEMRGTYISALIGFILAHLQHCRIKKRVGSASGNLDGSRNRGNPFPVPERNVLFSKMLPGLWRGWITLDGVAITTFREFLASCKHLSHSNSHQPQTRTSNKYNRRDESYVFYMYKYDCP